MSLRDEPFAEPRFSARRDAVRYHQRRQPIRDEVGSHTQASRLPLVQCPCILRCGGFSPERINLGTDECPIHRVQGKHPQALVITRLLEITAQEAMRQVTPTMGYEI